MKSRDREKREMQDADTIQLMNGLRMKVFDPTKSPVVSITKNGDLYINGAAMAEMGNPSRVTLWYEPGLPRIAFRNEPDHHLSYAVSRAGKGGRVRGACFLKHYAIPYGEESKRYPAYMENGFLVCELGDA